MDTARMFAPARSEAMLICQHPDYQVLIVGDGKKILRLICPNGKKSLNSMSLVIENDKAKQRYEPVNGMENSAWK
jgi:hypothetical protein